MADVDVRLGDVVVRIGTDSLDGDVADRGVEDVAGGALVHAPAVTVRPPGPATRFYRHGWQSWSQTRWLDVDEPVRPVPVADLRVLDDDPVHALSDRHGGASVGALATSDGVMLLGAVGLHGRVELDDGALVGTSDVADRWFVALGDEEQVFAAYAELLGDELGRRPVRAPRVWCSWYSFYTAIDEPALDAVLDDLDEFDIDVFQVDDGWQREVGDWQADDDFPSGMPALVERIRARGYEAGLWMAPFLAHERSEVAAKRPEWLLRDDEDVPVSAGWNWGGRLYALDVARDDVLDHLRDVMRRAVDWGFSYLKLDFLYAGALPAPGRTDRDRMTAYRRAVASIRDAVGEETALLACGAPVVASVGVFDALRVGPDVAEWWENDLVTRYLHYLGGPQTRYAIATSVHRLWLGSLLATDPDVAYFRTRGCLLTPDQKRLLQDLTRVCRFRATSDIPATLDDDERAALRDYFAGDPAVEALGGYRYRVDGRLVDFGGAASVAPTFLPLE